MFNKIISYLNLIIFVLLVSGSGIADNHVYIGKDANIKEDGTDLKVVYNGTTRLVVRKSSGDITFGATHGTASSSFYGNIGYIDVLNVGTTSSGADDFNVTGTSGFSGAVSVTGTTSYIKFPSLTSTQRDNLTASAGMVIWNTTTTKLQVYDGGVSGWIDLH